MTNILTKGNLILILFFTSSICLLRAQVGVNTKVIPAYSALEINVDPVNTVVGTKGLGGFHIPRVSGTAAIDALINTKFPVDKTPVAGMLIYDTLAGAAKFWDGTAWQQFNTGSIAGFGTLTSPDGTLTVTPAGDAVFFTDVTAVVAPQVVSPDKMKSASSFSIFGLDASGLPIMIPSNSLLAAPPYFGVENKSDNSIGLGGSIPSDFDLTFTATTNNNFNLLGAGNFVVSDPTATHNFVVDATNKRVGINMPTATTTPRTDLDVNGSFSVENNIVATDPVDIDVATSTAFVNPGYGKVTITDSNGAALAGANTYTIDLSALNPVTPGQQLTIYNNTSIQGKINGGTVINSKGVQKLVYTNGAWRSVALSTSASNMQGFQIALPANSNNVPKNIHDWDLRASGTIGTKNYNNDVIGTNPKYSTALGGWMVYTKLSAFTSSGTRPAQMYLIYQYMGPALDITNASVFLTLEVPADQNATKYADHFNATVVSIANVVPTWTADPNNRFGARNVNGNAVSTAGTGQSGTGGIIPNGSTPRTQVTVLITRADSSPSGWGFQYSLHMLYVNKAYKN